MAKNWWQKKEKAGYFWLNLTIHLVNLLPKFLLKISIFFVTFIYFLISKDERAGLREFYTQISIHTGKKRDNFIIESFKVYQNFYEFGIAICDKIAVWKDKIKYNDLNVVNLDTLNNQLRGGLRGSILLVSHYGNIEIARALSNSFSKLNIVILAYKSNSSNFMEMINKISKNKLRILFIDTLDISTIIELEKIIESGGHIGIMGDRVAMSNDKNIKINFLGKSCCFPMGAYLMAGILKTRVNTLWCERIGGRYQVELETISCTDSNPDGVVNLGKDRVKSTTKLMQLYINSLQKRVIKNPQLWFNFYDYWNQDVKTKISI